MNNLIEKIKKGCEIPFQEFLEYWGRLFPLLYKLKDTIQDNEWHAEGNVEIHTEMVLVEIYKIIKQNEFTEDEKIVLVLSALFHDICKPLCTKEKELNGKIRVVSPRHEEKARNYLLFRLLELGLPKKQAIDIINLSGYHQLPKLMVVRDKEKSDYFQLARKVNVKLIYYLEMADMLGRTCIDKDSQVELLDIFKLYCQDFGIWDNQNELYSDFKAYFNKELDGFEEQTKQFVLSSAIESFESKVITCKEEELARSYGYRGEYSHLVVLCGLSGVGKSTFIKKNYPDYEVVSLDKLRDEMSKIRSNKKNDIVLHKAKDILKVLLAKNKKIVWDATNYRKDFRKIPIRFGYDYGAFVELITLIEPISKIKAQNKEREHVVPEDVIDNQIDKFELPEIEEAHVVRFV
jgi:predicted kinase